MLRESKQFGQCEEERTEHLRGKMNEFQTKGTNKNVVDAETQI